MQSRWLCLLLLPLLSLASGVEDVYPFDHVEDEKRFVDLLQRYRCVVCQNQSLADSNAPVAIDIKHVVYRYVKNGKTDQVLDDFLTERYGDFIRLSPPFHGLSIGLWLMPLGLVCTALLALWYFLTKRYAGKLRGE